MTHDPFAPGISLPTLVGIIPDWVDEAACGPDDLEARGMEANDFFPISKARPDSDADPNQYAKTICTGLNAQKKRLGPGCPVRIQCLDWAIEHDETHGVWGGMSPGERQELTGRPGRWPAKESA